jgi:hypothetical protein
MASTVSKYKAPGWEPKRGHEDEGEERKDWVKLCRKLGE